MKYFADKLLRLRVLSVFATFLLFSACISVKKESKTPTLLKTETAAQSELLKEVDRFARVDSMRAKVDVKFEDNSFADLGVKEAYKSADGEVVVQRPAMILLKVQVPIIKSDIVQMTSDGVSFRVALLNDGGTGKYKKFVKGTNNADYSRLQKTLTTSTNGSGEAKAAKESVNAFANLRPQHFTEAMLVRPIDTANVYTQTSTFEVEDDMTVGSQSPIRRVMRGYYMLDEYVKQEDGSLKISRRFWFDRVGGIRLAKQQIFDKQGEIESDIVYGKEGKLTEGSDYMNLPLEIQVTRPKEKYAMKLSYQNPESVMIGRKFPEAAFLLQNSWNLEEVDLDKKLSEVKLDQPTSNASKMGAMRYQ